jgi:small-conductance mechanosensitive channel
MPITQSVTDWGIATWTALAAGLSGLSAFIPNMIAAIALFIVGANVSSILFRLTEKLLYRLQFNQVLSKIGVDEWVQKSGLDVEPIKFIANCVKTVGYLATFLVVSEVVGLKQVSSALTGLASYIPNILGAGLILSLGIYIGNIVRQSLPKLLASNQIDIGETVPALMQGVIVFIASIAAIGQLGIAPTLMQTLYLSFIGVISVATALALGLGLRSNARDLVSSQIISSTYKIGDDISLNNIDFKISKFNLFNTELKAENGQYCYVPNHLLSEQVVYKGTSSSSKTPKLNITMLNETQVPEGVPVGSGFKLEEQHKEKIWRPRDSAKLDQ